MANYVNFKYGTLAAYQAIGTKDTNTLYFTDNGVIYKGDKPFSQTISFVDTLPESPAQGVLYVLPDYSAKVYNGVAFKDVQVGVVSTIGEDATNDAKTITQGALKTYLAGKLADYSTTTDVESKIATAKSEAITQAGKDADSKVSAAKEELQNEINAKIASVFRFKGAKATYAEVEALTDMVTGDVWHVEADGKEYVYTGEAWELLGFTVDLSAYATTEAVTAAINAKAEEIVGTINSTKTELEGKIKTVSDNLDAHTGNADIHVTAAKKAEWDAKATTDQVATAKSEAIAAAAADATSKANQALADAKSYADGLDSAMDTRVSAVESALTWGTV